MSRMSQLHADLIIKAESYGSVARDRWSHQWGLLTASSAVLDIADQCNTDEARDALLMAHQGIMEMYRSLRKMEVDSQDL